MKGSTQICILFDLKDKPRNKQKEKESSKTVDTKTNHDHHGVKGNKRISFSNISPLFLFDQDLLQTKPCHSHVFLYLSVCLPFTHTHTHKHKNINHKTTLPPFPHQKEKLKEMSSFSSVVAMIWKYLSVDSSFSNRKKNCFGSNEGKKITNAVSFKNTPLRK